jgi:hypothetical protein
MRVVGSAWIVNYNYKPFQSPRVRHDIRVFYRWYNLLSILVIFSLSTRFLAARVLILFAA